MAKVTYRGHAKPDDPVYKTGPVVGGKRIGKPVFAMIDASMSREQVTQNLIGSLRKSGFKISKETEAEARSDDDKKGDS